MARQLTLNGEIPFLIIRRFGVGIDAGDARVNRLIWIQRRETSGQRNQRSLAITDESRLIVERQVVSELQGIARPDFLTAIEQAVGGADYGVRKGRVSKPDSR